MADFDGGHAVAAAQRVQSWRFPSWRRAGIALLLTFGVAGCGSAGQVPLFGDAAGTTVALESIDGPPPSVFQKFVRDLNEEASTRQIAVAPAGGPAPYRLRGYLAASDEQGTTAIDWAWDVYDSADRRAFRVQGQEKAGVGRSAWAAADDEMLHRIARTSMEQLAVFLAAASAPVPPLTGVTAAATVPLLPVLVTFDDFRPEAAGIFRLLASEKDPANEENGIDARAEDIPLPPLRPAPPAAAAAFAFASPDR